MEKIAIEKLNEWEEIKDTQGITISRKWNAIEILAEKINELIDERNKPSCPPHNFIPYLYEGMWGASMPPPNMKCTKCLMTDRF